MQNLEGSHRAKSVALINTWATANAENEQQRLDRFNDRQTYLQQLFSESEARYEQSVVDSQTPIELSLTQVRLG